MLKFEEIKDEEIYELRKKALTYEEITKYFEKKGYDVSSGRIYNACERIFRIKREKVPNAKYNKRTNLKIKDEDIYELREKGLTFKEIEEYFTRQGKEVSANTIYNRCKTIYRLKGEERPKANTKNRIEISDEEIQEKRKEGLTYQEIAEYFTAQGKEISTSTVSVRCREMQIENPKKKIKNETAISDEDIYEQREKGLTYEAIAEYFTNQGRKISHQRIGQRCKRVYNEKEKSEPKATRKRRETTIGKEKIREEILRLQETKGATNEQMRKIASLYGISLEDNKLKLHSDENNSNGER